MTASNEIVVFALGERLLGVPSSTVQELIRAVAVTELPGAPPGVIGVIDVRGALVPVVDLSDRVGFAPRPIRSSDHLLICDATFGPLALRADRVLELRVAHTEAVPRGAEADAIVRSLMRTADGVIVICDLSEFLDETNIAALAGAIAQLETVA
ncbi:MAG: chemotaxis protein CheW [Deltaproteobacteria bacterium]